MDHTAQTLQLMTSLWLSGWASNANNFSGQEYNHHQFSREKKDSMLNFSSSMYFCFLSSSLPEIVTDDVVVMKKISSRQWQRRKK